MLRSRHLLSDKNDFLWAVEFNNVAMMENLMKIESADITIATVNKAFEMAISQENIVLISLLIDSKNFIKPDQVQIDKAFCKLAHDGSNPVLIYLLQNVISPHTFCAQQRIHSQTRKIRVMNDKTHYVVSFLEPEKLKEVEEIVSQHALKLKSPNQSVVLHAMLSGQRWMNRLFFDSVESHLKLVVHTLLSLPSSAPLKPDQMTINEVFLHTVQKGYLSMAEMLMACEEESVLVLPDNVNATEIDTNAAQNNIFSIPTFPPQNAEFRVERRVIRRGVDQQGFDQAVYLVLAEMELETPELVEWILSGRFGFVPSQDIVDEMYLERSRRAPRQHPSRIKRVFFMGREAWRMQRGSPSQILRYNRLTTMDGFVLERLTARASPEAVAIIAREVALAERRQRQLNLFRAQGVPEIHSYSDTVIRGDHDGDLPGADAIENEEDLQGDHMDVGGDDDHADGEVEEGEGGEEGGIVVAPAAVPVVAARRRGQSLQQVVLACIERRVGGVAFTMDQISAIMSALISTTFPTAQERQSAMEIVAEGMNAANERILGLTLNFLSGFPPAASTLWISGFLVESIAVNSCNPGAMERIITGLRGVEDPELSQIFTQAEGPNLARIFLMGTFNIYYPEHDTAAKEKARRNAENLARVLIARGVAPETPAEEVTEVLRAYASDSISAYGVPLSAFERDIATVVETVGDGFEDYLLPYIREIYNAQMLEQQAISPMEEGKDEEQS